jgi:hypothetical protein
LNLSETEKQLYRRMIRCEPRKALQRAKKV